MGLGYLADKARSVVGGDVDDGCLSLAEKQYAGCPGIRLEHFDAQSLPFADKSFHLLLLYEAIYYLPEPDRFIQDAFRVLRGDGILIICTANKDLSDFNPSPYSVLYYSIPELVSLLREKFSEVACYGGFPVSQGGKKHAVISQIKRAAVALHLMPKTMKGKAFLKRVFFGRLHPVPGEISEGMAEYFAPVPVPADVPDKTHKVLFVVGRKKDVAH